MSGLRRQRVGRRLLAPAGDSSAPVRLPRPRWISGLFAAPAAARAWRQGSARCGFLAAKATAAGLCPRGIRPNTRRGCPRGTACHIHSRPCTGTLVRQVRIVVRSSSSWQAPPSIVSVKAKIPVLRHLSGVAKMMIRRPAVVAVVALGAVENGGAAATGSLRAGNPYSFNPEPTATAAPIHAPRESAVYMIFARLLHKMIDRAENINYNVENRRRRGLRSRHALARGFSPTIAT